MRCTAVYITVLQGKANGSTRDCRLADPHMRLLSVAECRELTAPLKRETMRVLDICFVAQLMRRIAKQVNGEEGAVVLGRDNHAHIEHNDVPLLGT